eukprot:1185409-Prymnesium_polylepis.2
MQRGGKFAGAVSRRCNGRTIVEEELVGTAEREGEHKLGRDDGRDEAARCEDVAARAASVAHARAPSTLKGPRVEGGCRAQGAGFGEGEGEGHGANCELGLT